MRRLFQRLRKINIEMWDLGNKAFGQNYDWNMAFVCTCLIVMWCIGLVPAVIGGYVVDWAWLSAPMVVVPLATFGVRKSRAKHLLPRFVEAMERIAAALEKLNETQKKDQ